MQLRYKFRLYPSPGQRQALAQAFGCARTVYNDALRARVDAKCAGSPYPKSGDLSKILITQAKKTVERAWLADVSAVVLQQSLRDLDTAYKNYFTSRRGSRRGRKVDAPRYKSRKDARQSIRFTRNGFTLRNGLLNLAKVGVVEVRWSRSLPSDPTSVTVIKDASDRYFASFVVETAGSEVLPSIAGEVGLDLGLSHFAVLSDGTKISSPRFLRRAEKKLRKMHRTMSRKEKGSNNRRKAALRLTKGHAKVADARRDWQHKLSTTLIRENQAVYVEDLNVAGLRRTRLAKSVSDAGWSRFVAMLEYKATRYGRTFQRVDRMFPSSQICSACGVKDGPKPLNVRAWTCKGCGTVHDRDINAAHNIKTEGKRIVAAGRADTENACGAQVRPVLVPAPRREAGTHPKPTTAPQQWEQAGIPGI